MFFNRICEFAAETGILLGVLVDTAGSADPCLAGAWFQDSDGPEYTSIAALWIEQSMRSVIVQAVKRTK